MMSSIRAMTAICMCQWHWRPRMCFIATPCMCQPRWATSADSSSRPATRPELPQCPRDRGVRNRIKDLYVKSNFAYESDAYVYRGVAASAGAASAVRRRVQRRMVVALPLSVMDPHRPQTLSEAKDQRRFMRQISGASMIATAGMIIRFTRPRRSAMRAIPPISIV